MPSAPSLRGFDAAAWLGSRRRAWSMQRAAVLIPTPAGPADGGGEIGDAGKVAAAQRLAVDDGEEQLLGLLNGSLGGLVGIDLAANGLGGLGCRLGLMGLFACGCHRRPPCVLIF